MEGCVEPQHSREGKDRHVVGLVVERVAGSFAPETSASGEWVVAEASGGKPGVRWLDTALHSIEIAILENQEPSG